MSLISFIKEYKKPVKIESDNLVIDFLLNKKIRYKNILNGYFDISYVYSVYYIEKLFKKYELNFKTLIINGKVKYKIFFETKTGRFIECPIYDDHSFFLKKFKEHFNLIILNDINKVLLYKAYSKLFNYIKKFNLDKISHKNSDFLYHFNQILIKFGWISVLYKNKIRILKKN